MTSIDRVKLTKTGRARRLYLVVAALCLVAGLAAGIFLLVKGTDWLFQGEHFWGVYITFAVAVLIGVPLWKLVIEPSDSHEANIARTVLTGVLLFLVIPVIVFNVNSFLGLLTALGFAAVVVLIAFLLYPKEG